MWQLARILLCQLEGRPDVILVQNPPSIPTLAVALVAAWVHRAALIVDWHNFGYSLLALNFGAESTIVRVAREYERWMGQCADGHLCVTQAMQTWLRETWEIDAHVLHDRSQAHFHRLDADEAHQLFTALLNDQKLCPELKGDQWMGIDRARCHDEETLHALDAATERTPFTYIPSSAASASSSSSKSTPTSQPSSSASGALFRPDRPTLILSSTSWTADEDFTILARAIERHDRAIAKSREAATEEEEEETEGEAASTITKRGGSKKKSTASKAASASSNPSATPTRPLPRAVYIITGKGPLRSAFVSSISQLSLRFSSVHTLFVSAGDYPKLLGAGDLGVSLHYSSSGLDLPMKVVDMFGAGLPVCAVDFASIGELVRDGVNGRVFGRRKRKHAGETTQMVTQEKGTGQEPPSAAPESAAAAAADASADADVDPSIELADQFVELFQEFGRPDDAGTQLARLRAGALAWSQVTWQSCWDASCGPMLTARELAHHRAEMVENRKSMVLKLVAMILIVVGGLMMVL